MVTAVDKCDPKKKYIALLCTELDDTRPIFIKLVESETCGWISIGMFHRAVKRGDLSLMNRSDFMRYSDCRDIFFIETYEELVSLLDVRDL